MIWRESDSASHGDREATEIGICGTVTAYP